MYRKIIENYKPINEQEHYDRLSMLNFIDKNENALSRDNLVAHFTTSAIVVNKSLDKVLFAYHLIYKSWAWLGGHNDLDSDFLNVAVKEAKEESGLLNVYPLEKNPIMLDQILVQTHIKNGKYVGDHLHLNLTYLLYADENEKLTVKEDENSGVKWFKISDVLGMVKEERMIPIYKKAFDYIDKNRDVLIKVIKNDSMD